MLFFDGNLDTEGRLHEDDIFEYDLGQVVLAGTSITFFEGAGGEDEDVAVYVSFGSMDPAGDANNATGGGVGYLNTVTNGLATEITPGG